MTIQEKINTDLKQAMLSKDEAKKSLLRVLIGEFNRVDKIVDDSKAIAIIKKMVENASIVGTPAALIEKALLESYLPKQLTSDQLLILISQLIEDKGYTSSKDMGKIMGDLKNEYAGQYDGKLASELIKQRFSHVKV